MSDSKSKIVYTLTDEAPALATFSFLPVLRSFLNSADVDVEIADISLASRILAAFPSSNSAEHRDYLGELGKLVKLEGANIIKLPNISASIPQLTDAIAELQSKGFNVPDYPQDPKTDEEKQIKQAYSKVLGSAVNPVLREGNSDRRVAGPVKKYAKLNPHRVGEWKSSSKSHVAHMTEGDFYGSEKSYVCQGAKTVKIEFTPNGGSSEILRDNLELLDGEIIDVSLMSKKALCEFFEREIEKAKAEDILLSLHVKATMMKVSAPIIFGHAVTSYYSDLFSKHADTFSSINVNPNNGIGDVYDKVDQLPASKSEEIKSDVLATYKTKPRLAMVNSDKGITNLHVPSDVIIDASMAAMIRAGGQMWGEDGKTHDTKALIPDRSYAPMYQACIDFCKENGAFDVTTMGNVSNVGLMAQKAQEYGSHDKTFEIKSDGVVKVVCCSNGKTLLEHSVGRGDIWRMCQTKDLPIQDWVKLAVHRAKSTGLATVFWLDSNRSHDAELIKKVNKYLENYDVSSLDIKILSPVDAMRYTCEKIKTGEDVISVTGNVLRDYLTDLFPILELGTSAKMLSIVPLLAGGGLFETGAGGSAPKHVQQFIEEGHLRWDSLGEFLALAVSLEDIAEKTKNTEAKVLSEALTKATSEYLEKSKSPSYKVKELDTRGSHFYLTLFWAQALAEQDESSKLKAEFAEIASSLKEKEAIILQELEDAQGSPVDIDGYYLLNEKIVSEAMRPSATFNKVVA